MRTRRLGIIGVAAAALISVTGLLSPAQAQTPPKAAPAVVSTVHLAAAYPQSQQDFASCTSNRSQYYALGVTTWRYLSATSVAMTNSSITFRYKANALTNPVDLNWGASLGTYVTVNGATKLSKAIHDPSTTDTWNPTDTYFQRSGQRLEWVYSGSPGGVYTYGTCYSYPPAPS